MFMKSTHTLNTLAICSYHDEINECLSKMRSFDNGLESKAYESITTSFNKFNALQISLCN